VALCFAVALGVEAVGAFEAWAVFALFAFEASSSLPSFALRLRDGRGELDESLPGDTFRFNVRGDSGELYSDPSSITIRYPSEEPEESGVFG
jgi:hypothetical protein